MAIYQFSDGEVLTAAKLNQALAQADDDVAARLPALETATADTGWVAQTSGSLFTNNDVFARRIGNAVYLRGKFTLAAGGNLSNITYGAALALSSEFRPKFDVHLTITARNPTATNSNIRPQAVLEILPTGRVNLHVHATGLDMALPGMVSYVLG